MAKKSTEIKQKGLFDHLNQIRGLKNPDYYDSLTEHEKKTFNQYVILMGLSMDKECIEEMSYLSKYLNIIPNRQFYRVCCDMVPYGKKFGKWIKNSKVKLNKELVTKIAEYFEIGISDARDYCEIMIESNVDELKAILSKFGLSEKEIKGLLK
jgi:hypothetical protein